MTFLIFGVRGFISGAFQGFYVYTPEVRCKLRYLCFDLIKTKNNMELKWVHPDKMLWLGEKFFFFFLGGGVGQEVAYDGLAYHLGLNKFPYLIMLHNPEVLVLALVSPTSTRPVLRINPLRPSIELQILLLCFHTFITEVVGRSCSNINRISFE